MRPHRSNEIIATRTLLVALAVLLFFSAPAGAQEKVERREMGQAVIEGIPEIPEALTQRLFQYQSTRSAGLQSWDVVRGGILISTRFAETRQLHYVATPGAARQQITFFPEPIGGATMNPSPDHHGFLFTKDIGGNEAYQIFWHDLKTGQHRLLTDGKSRHGYTVWSKDGEQFAYFTTERNGKDWDIHVDNPFDRSRSRALVQKAGTWAPLDWSADGKQLLVTKYVSINESYLYAVTVRNGRLKQINPAQGKISYGNALFTADGKGVYYTSDEGGEFLSLYHYDLRKKEKRILTRDISWDVGELDLSEDGKTLAFTVNEGGADRLYLMNTETEKYEPIKDLPIGQIYGLSFHPDNKRLGMVLNTPKTPGDVFVLNLPTRKMERWTYSEVGGLDTNAFVEPTLIEFETFDKVDGKPRKIPAFYYKPKGKGPHPVLISIHGGPESQFRPYFSSSVQYYINEMGIAVLAPNVRGSAGYGKSYLQLDNGMKREDSVKDIGALLDWIEKQPELDHKRVAVAGGSYGGYMVLATMTHYDDRLRCGVDVVGISNFVTFLKNTKDYRRDLRRAEYGDERDPAMNKFLEKISPSNNATKIKSPLFIAQGANDPRVPASEAEQMLSEMRGAGGTAWYLLFKDEGHGFSKKSNADYYRAAMVMFLEQYLLPKKSASR